MRSKVETRISFCCHVGLFKREIAWKSPQMVSEGQNRYRSYGTALVDMRYISSVRCRTVSRIRQPGVMTEAWKMARNGAQYATQCRTSTLHAKAINRCHGGPESEMPRSLHACPPSADDVPNRAAILVSVHAKWRENACNDQPIGRSAGNTPNLRC